RMVHARALPWVRDVVPALAGLAIHFDPDHPDAFGDAMSASLNVVSECLKQGLPKEDDASRTVEVPICYEREFAPDLAEVAAAAKEIGRASCRERVEMWVGGVSVRVKQEGRT